jgi:hypothetical protein
VLLLGPKTVFAYESFTRHQQLPECSRGVGMANYGGT